MLPRPAKCASSCKREVDNGENVIEVGVPQGGEREGRRLVPVTAWRGRQLFLLVLFRVRSSISSRPYSLGADPRLTCGSLRDAPWWIYILLHLNVLLGPSPIIQSRLLAGYVSGKEDSALPVAQPSSQEPCASPIARMPHRRGAPDFALPGNTGVLRHVSSASKLVSVPPTSLLFAWLTLSQCVAQVTPGGRY